MFILNEEIKELQAKEAAMLEEDIPSAEEKSIRTVRWGEAAGGHLSCADQ